MPGRSAPWTATVQPSVAGPSGSPDPGGSARGRTATTNWKRPATSPSASSRDGAVTPSGAETTNITAKWPWRFVIVESSRLQPRSTRTPLTAATMPGRSAPSALSHRRPIAKQYVTVSNRCVRGRELGGATFGVMSAPVPVKEGLFTDSDPPHLLGGRCRTCGHHHFPRRPICPYCASDATEPVELSATGRLWAWTAVTHPPPGYKGKVPYGFGVVELPEGLRVVTRLT